MWGNCHYLVTVDGFSDYIELDRLGRDTTATTIIKKTRSLFSRYGKPDELHTDSDPRYLSDEFQKFLRSWQVAHKASSPHHHQANGKSESGVKAAKRLVKKCEFSGQCLDEALLEWRLTPQAEGLSPAEKFLGRKPASTIPTRASTLETENAERVQKDIQGRRLRQKTAHDKHARPLPPIAVGQEIRIQPMDYTHEWSKGTCIERIDARTYRIRTQNGTQLIRNRRYLVVTPNTQPTQNSSQDHAPTNAHIPILRSRPERTQQQTSRAAVAPKQPRRNPARSTRQGNEPVARPATPTAPKRPTRKRPPTTPTNLQSARRLRQKSPARTLRSSRQATPGPRPRDVQVNKPADTPKPMELSFNRKPSDTTMPMEISTSTRDVGGTKTRITRSGRPILTPARLRL